MAKVYRNAEFQRRIQERLFVRIAKAHEIRLRRELASQYVSAARAVERGNRKPKINGDRIETAVSAMMRDGFQQSGRTAQAAIQETIGRGGKREVPMSPEFEAMLNDYIKRFAGAKIKDIDDTTKARIAQIIRRGVADGLTNREISSLIREAGLIDSGYRAAVIARTESHSAVNAGSMASAAESGVVEKKEWISADDDRTREGHRNVSSVPMDEPFIVEGEKLEYPGDPSGSAGNIINCRCTIGYVV